MAIAPSQFKELFDKQCAFFEEQIDCQIMKQSYNIVIYIFAPVGMLKKHFDVIKPNYINMGCISVDWEESRGCDSSAKIIFSL